MKRNSLFLLLGSLLFLSSCQKDPNGPYWDVDVITPLMKTELGLGSLVSDTLLQEGSDGSLTLVYESDFQSFDVDSLVQIPDTSIEYEYTIPFYQYNLFQGQKLMDINGQTEYNLTDIELTSFTVKTATIDIEVQNDVTDIIELYFAIPTATDSSGAIFEHLVYIPAAPDTLTPTFYQRSFDLAGYTINMRGGKNDKVNVMDTRMQARINTNGNGVTMYFADTLKIKSAFKDIVPQAATGYFGQHEFSIGPEELELNLFNNIDLEQIQLSDAELTLSIENGFGIDARGIINQLQSKNTTTGNKVDLTANLIGSNLNINSASLSGDPSDPVTPSEYIIELNKNNSNITDFIENLPDQFSYALDFETSPLGNISASNDFIHLDYGFNANLKLEVPLNVGIQNLHLSDTAALDFDEESRENKINGGELIVSTYNHFPFETQLQLYFYDEEMTLKDSLFTTPGVVLAGEADGSGKISVGKETRLIIPVSKQKLNRILSCSNIVIDSRLSTMPPNTTVPIYQDYQLEVKLAARFNYELGLE